MGFFKSKKVRELQKDYDEALKKAAPPDRGRWITLRKLLTGEQIDEFFGNEFDLLKKDPRIHTLSIDDRLTVHVITRLLPFEGVDPTDNVKKRISTGAYSFELELLRESTPVASGTARLNSIVCVASARHDGSKRFLYHVGGDATGGFCFGNGEGNTYLLGLLGQGELFSAITFIIQGLSWINENNRVEAFCNFRELLPNGQLSKRKPASASEESPFAIGLAAVARATGAQNGTD